MEYNYLILFAYFQLDYITRLMWQGQVKGNKTWSLAPTPECDSRCKPFQFYVEPGDAGKRILMLFLSGISIS